MKKITFLPAFRGYYQSGIDDFDESSELEYINEQREENGLDALENTNDFIWDYTEWRRDISIQLCYAVESYLQEMGMVKNIKYLELISPKFYNFSNDKIKCEINVNVVNVKKYIDENKEEFTAFLKDNFTSCSGFVSFYSNELEYWIERMKNFNELDGVEVQYILWFILHNEDFDLIDRAYNFGMCGMPYVPNILNYETLITE